MRAEELTECHEVTAILRDLRRAIPEKHFSDFLDAEGNQYVDLVMEGGGVLGIALVGYTYVMEEMGIRFLRIAGTSAGAINALLIASLGPPSARKSVRIAGALANLRLWDFIDGGSGVRRFVAALLKGAWPPIIVFRGLVILYRIFRYLGLNPGEVFERWLTGILAEGGIQTSADLTRVMRTLPAGFRTREGKLLAIDDADPYLAIVAADITTETKVEFPRMAPLYWTEPEKENPAAFVRASMSIPFVFQPRTLRQVPQGPDAEKRWRDLASFSGTIPPLCVLVDGGIMSNFPIDLFHTPESVPSAPTFGVKLGGGKRHMQDVGSPFSLGGAVFNAARHTLDYDFLVRHPDYSELVAHVDTAGFNWLDFGMSDRQKIDLFVRGAQAAMDFLISFDWEKYKEIREGTARAFAAARRAPAVSTAGTPPETPIS